MVVTGLAGSMEALFKHLFSMLWLSISGLLPVSSLARSTPTFSCLRCALLWLSASFGLLHPTRLHWSSDHRSASRWFVDAWLVPMLDAVVRFVLLSMLCEVQLTRLEPVAGCEGSDACRAPKVPRSHLFTLVWHRCAPLQVWLRRQFQDCFDTASHATSITIARLFRALNGTFELHLVVCASDLHFPPSGSSLSDSLVIGREISPPLPFKRGELGVWHGSWRSNGTVQSTGTCRLPPIHFVAPSSPRLVLVAALGIHFQPLVFGCAPCIAS